MRAAKLNCGSGVHALWTQKYAGERAGTAGPGGTVPRLALRAGSRRQRA
jgi:hypothetical protein